MKRKFLSFAIAFALIAQTLVYAGPLTDLLGSTIEVDIDKSDDIGRTDVNATVTSFVKGSTEGDTAYAATSTASSFDYKVGINFETVRQAFDACYTRGFTLASGEGYGAEFNNSDITGEFYIDFVYDTNITGTLPTTADLILPAGSIFAVTDVSQTASNIVRVTVNVASPIKVSALKADIDTVDGAGKYSGTALADFELVWPSLSTTSKNNQIKASLTGYVDVTEDSASAFPFARVNFTSNTSIVTAAYYVGGGGGGGAVTPTPTPTPTPSSDEGITIDEGGDISTGTESPKGTKENTTTEKNDDTTITTTTSENKTTEKDKNSGTTTTTTTTKEVVKETDNETGQTNKVTITETTETTEKAKDGTTTTTTVTKETVKETNPDTGVTNIAVSETTETAAESGAVAGTTTSSTTVAKKLTVAEKPVEKPGFIANGWSTTPYSPADKDYDGVSELEATVTEITVTTTTVVVDENGEPVLDENGEEQLVTTVTTTTDISLYPVYVNTVVPSALEPEIDENGNALHKVYIAGYPDGEVKPNNNITREEVTAAFDRLLNTVYRETIATTDQDFPDVNDDRWSNDSIATMAKGGYIVGDENGNFNPDKPITRAEFAVIAAKFAPVDAEVAENYFTDIDGHWAKDFILKVAGQCWIFGRGDGSFDPDAPITRAEAMTIINRMLFRYGDESSDYATQWPDVDKTDWFYESVIEATTHNTYERTENGWSEKWVAPELAEVVEEKADEPATEEEAIAEEDADAETETPTKE